MPLYDYQCSNCQKVVEVRHGFNDSYSDPCAACGGELKRVFNPAPIVFKGSGFYITDSRKPSSGEKSSSSSDSSSSSSKESAA
jgi:putative FmdB family regulatory protein